MRMNVWVTSPSFVVRKVFFVHQAAIKAKLILRIRSRVPIRTQRPWSFLLQQLHPMDKTNILLQPMIHQRRNSSLPHKKLHLQCFQNPLHKVLFIINQLNSESVLGSFCVAFVPVCTVSVWFCVALLYQHSVMWSINISTFFVCPPYILFL